MRLPLSVWQDAAGMGAGLSSMGEQQVAKFEYGQWTEYTTRKGGFVRGEPVMAYFFTTETSEVLLTATSIIAALNEVGRDGWEEYRVENQPKPPGKRPGMEIERAKRFQERHDYMPGSIDLHATRWFRRVDIVGYAVNLGKNEL